MDTEVYKKSQEFLQTEGMQKIMVSTVSIFRKPEMLFINSWSMIIGG